MNAASGNPHDVTADDFSFASETASSFTYDRVFNSVGAYLQGKLETIAMLRTLGLRHRRLAALYLLQVGMLSGASSLAGCVVGSVLAIAILGLLLVLGGTGVAPFIYTLF